MTLAKMVFDIILPSIGRPSIQEAINSVIDQSYQDWQLYVILDSFKASNLGVIADDRIHVLEMWDNLNEDSGTRARNHGISVSNMPWITYLDDDDIWRPDHLTTIMECAILHPEANMIRTAGQSFSWRHRSPRHKKKVRKLGVINNTDILTVGMAHTRDLFSRTTGWASCDNHDHKLWNDMLAAGGIPVVSNKVTFEFER